mgnify:CR=1 FL=1
METIKAILTRRSIRKFTAKAVSDEKIKILLEAAMHAPSAGNSQPWHFIVVKDRKILDKIPDFHPHAMMLKACNTAIIVCADPAMEKYKNRWSQDCSAATENILLAAHASGLGAVWVGIYPVEERVKGTSSLLNLPKRIIPFSIVALGYPAEEKKPGKRFKPDRIHHNTW